MINKIKKMFSNKIFSRKLLFVLIALAVVVGGVAVVLAAMTYTGYTDETTSGQTIKASSATTALLGININDGAAPNDTLTSVAIDFTNVSGFTNGDLASGKTGVTIYDDSGASSGVFDGTDAAIGTTTVTWTGLTATVNIQNAVIPDDDAGVNSGDDFFVVIRTSASIANGDQFTATLGTNSITTSIAGAGGATEEVTYTITADTTVPTLTTVTIASNNASTTLAKTGDTITLTFIGSENLTSKPTVTIATHAIAAGSVLGSGTNWTATYVMVAEDTEGNVPFTINFTDIATNAGVEVAATTNSSAVTFDKTAPTAPNTVTFTAVGGTVTANTANTTNTNFTGGAVITAGQATGGYAELLKGGNPFTTPVRDNTILVGDASVTFDAGLTLNADVQTQLAAGGVLSVIVYDAAGNSTASTVGNPTVTTDWVVPAFASIALGLDEYVNAAETTAGVNIVIATTGAENGRTVSCSITDVGSAHTVGPVTGVIATNAVTIASTALTTLDDGLLTVTCNVTDTAGNPAVAGTDTATKDVVAPTLTTAIVGTSIQAASDTITLVFNDTNAVSAADADWTDCNEISAIQSPDGTTKTLTGATCAYTAGTKTLVITLAEAATNIQTYLINGNAVAATPAQNKIQDAAGNYLAITEMVSSATVTGDVTGPTVVLTYSPDRTVTPFETIVITATFNEKVAQVSVPTIAISTPGDGDLTATNMTKTSDTVWTYNWSVPGNTDEQGTATITITATDLAGNSNFTAPDNTRTIDSIAPIVNAFTAGTITATGAILTVTTNEAATCKYANTEKDYSSMEAMESTGGTTHTHALTSLTASTNYNYYVRCADGSGNTMGYSAHVGFATLGADTVVPTADSQTPVNGATGVAITVSPTVTFSENMATSTVNTTNVQLRLGDGDAVVASTVTYANKVATIHPSASLSYETAYWLWISGAQDVALNYMTASTTESQHTFTTVASGADTGAPTADSQTPINGATGQAITVTPTVTFSENMATSTINTTNVQLRLGDGDAVVASTVTYANKVATIYPSASLSNSTAYWLWISGAQDVAGNYMTASTTESQHTFTTVAVGNGTLALTAPIVASSTRTTAIADDTYGNGWAWDFYITVPTTETSFQMKFSDWTGTSATMATANNIKFYSSQATSTDAITISAADTTYSATMTLTGELTAAQLLAGTGIITDPANLPGRQIRVTVEVKVPAGTAGGSYSTSYQIKSS